MHDIPGNSVAVGNTARIIRTYESFVSKYEKLIQNKPCYGQSYTLRNRRLCPEEKAQMVEEIDSKGIWFVV